ncbi:MAG: ABC transporter ATP-binding protein [Fluviicola sp.]|jgi:ABC-2 type transport system ATP-binding protein|nr:ABC transporter ATP-binding protein [Fluviicola sp.]MBP6272846.1 ABC transporter ATP-binding protein [Fluviicola sp.]
MLFQEKITTTASHFQNNDISLGYRSLIDCVLDTQHLPFYKEIIQLTEWKESAAYSENELHERVTQLLGHISEFPVNESGNNEVLIETTAIKKRYGNQKFAIGPISISIKAGEVWGLVGENGNGKTTLLRILAKDLSYNEGELSVAFEEEAIDEYDLRTKLTYIPQRTPKWFGSLKSNLKFTAAHYGIKGEENELLVLMMIIRFGLWNFRNHQWSELSSGYKMRFELARTFLRAPKILLLDEPLANLDVMAQQLILEDLKSLSQSISNPIGIVLSSQQLFEVEKIADQVLFLSNGSPTFMHEITEKETRITTVIELEVTCERPQLTAALSDLVISELSFNGGVYMVTIEGENQMHALMSTLVAHAIEVKYIRNISHSTRRLFLK